MKDEIIKGAARTFFTIDVRIAINWEVSSSSDSSFCWVIAPDSTSS